jgi:hydrogenase-1 operon protein HyaF
MRAVNIPIRSLMPEPDDAVDYMPMPREMSTFEMPRVPEPGADADVAGARDVLATFLQHFGHWLAQGGEPPALDLASLAPDTLRVLNETLGEGEVAAIVKPGSAGHEIRIQESVFAGVWREQHFDAGEALVHDYLLAAPIPQGVGKLAHDGAAPRLRELPLPAGAMNVPALVHELQDAMDRVLDGGTVVILSRGFGNCRISSTAARHVWRVQYFNNMQTLILNTIEVVAMPEVAVAAREDLVESHERLAELLQWMSDSIATA